MSSRTEAVEWVETTEEVVIIESCLPPDSITPTVIPVLQAADTPIQKLLDAVDDPGSGDGFYCEECVPLFQEQSDQSKLNGPSFVLDFPTSMGVPQRALLTLPYGLMIGRSSIPNAGVGVINHGPVVDPGMHFGPYEGEETTVENALASAFSWEIYKGQGNYGYVDAARESLSNWMRYVNCARNKEETNLLAVQYKGSILFHCCRTINPGDELLVWPSSKLLSHFSEAWTQMWSMKLKAAESISSATPQVFLCSRRQLSFTTEAFLQRHTQHFQTQLQDDCNTPTAEPENPASTAESGLSAASVMEVSVDPAKSKTCSDCGKTFKQIPHLRRHKLSVHSNRRPYCCPQCRRSFSQASGLIRHQLVHRKHTAPKAAGQDKNDLALASEGCNPADEAGSEEMMEATGADGSSIPEEELSNNCCECGKRFTNKASLKKHKVMVHDNLRPYVCTVCRKCFGQYNDLTRHQQRHQKDGERPDPTQDEAPIMPFSCAECSRTFSDVDALQQHVSRDHSEDAELDGGDKSCDPDFIPQPWVAETVESVLRRPQRRGAGAKISAITKLIAPRRRSNVCTKSESSGRGQTEAETPAVGNGDKHKRFSCNLCKQTYGTPADLKAHRCTVTPHTCSQCNATFKKSGFLKRHEQMVHAEAKSYSCERCQKVFTTPGKLKQHQKMDTCKKYHCASEFFSCSFCDFSFTMKSYLMKHIRRHHPVQYLSLPASGLADRLEEEEEEEECTCPHCGKTYESTKAFKTHACFQQLKVLYLCTDCGKGFSNHYSLRQHQRIHTGEKPHRCPQCSKSFAHSGQLNVHLRTHTGERPYLCTHCGESFRQSGDLKRHERKHTGVRPYSCPECCKSFSRSQSLKAHQMLHQGQRMFKCTQCGKSFSRNYHLRRHHQKMHL